VKSPLLHGEIINILKKVFTTLHRIDDRSKCSEILVAYKLFCDVVAIHENEIGRAHV
jgi:hypothetical protein